MAPESSEYSAPVERKSPSVTAEIAPPASEMVIFSSTLPHRRSVLGFTVRKTELTTSWCRAPARMSAAAVRHTPAVLLLWRSPPVSVYTPVRRHVALSLFRDHDHSLAS